MNGRENLGKYILNTASTVMLRTHSITTNIIKLEMPIARNDVPPRQGAVDATSAYNGFPPGAHKERTYNEVTIKKTASKKVLNICCILFILDYVVFDHFGEKCNVCYGK